MESTYYLSAISGLSKFEPRNSMDFQIPAFVGSNFSCPAPNIPVYEYMVEWLDSRRYALQLSTCNSYEMMINGRIRKYFSKKEITVASLRPFDIRSFYTAIFQDGCSAATVIHYHAVLHKAFK